MPPDLLTEYALALACDEFASSSQAVIEYLKYVFEPEVR